MKHDKFPEIPQITTLVKTGDCVKEMRKLKAKSVDVIVTSPPYNIGKDYNRYMDRRDQEEYLEWCKEWADEVARVMKPMGSFFLNLGGCPSNPTIPHELLFHLIKEAQGGAGGPFVLQNTIHWIKSITVIDDNGNEVTQGHFKPINSKRYVNDCHEYIFHLTHTGETPLERLAVGVAYKHKSNIKRWKGTGGKDKRCRGNTWFIPYRTIQSRSEDRPHPAPFPPELPEQCIRLHGIEEGKTIVLDPFLGIGNSWIGALRCKVGKFIGFDMDKQYVAQAKKYASDPETVWTYPYPTDLAQFAGEITHGDPAN